MAIKGLTNVVLCNLRKWNPPQGTRLDEHRTKAFYYISLLLSKGFYSFFPAIMDSKTNRFHLYLSAFILNLNYFICGMGIAWSSPVLVKLPLSDKEGSRVASMLPLGAVAGSFISGLLLDRIGRKALIALSLSLVSGATIILTFGEDPLVLAVGRFTYGTCLGISFAAVPLYIGEISEDSVRGSLNTLIQLFSNSGGLLMYAVGPFVSYSVLHYLILSICVLTLVLTPLLPVSPYYAVMKGDVEGARNSLIWLRGKGQLELVEKELREIRSTIQESQTGNSSFKSLLTSVTTRRALFICCVLVIVNQCSGITVLGFYSQKIFHMTGTDIPSSICSIIVGVIMVFSALISPLAVKSFGYRTPLIVSGFGMAFGTGGLGTFFLLKSFDVNVKDLNWLPLLSFVIFILFVNIGFATVPLALLGELFPSETKSSASTIVTLITKGFAFLTTNLFTDLVFLFGQGAVFMMFASFSLFGAFFTIVAVTDTSRMSLLEIQTMLKGKKKDYQSVKERNQLV